MRNFFTLLIIISGLGSVLHAQTALDPDQFVNAQITEAGVYTVEAGQFYAFDGTLELAFDVTIEGPDNGWIMEDATPPVLLQTPGSDGSQRQFFTINTGGSLTLKNVLFSGTHSNAEVVGTFVRNTGGSKLVADNCVFTDWEDFALRNSYEGDTLSVTNCVFINGVRLRYSKWGGFPVRLDVACDEVIYENNTTVNTGRLLANAGPFFNAGVYEMHNTFINQSVVAEETRGKEYMIANNIYYNYHFLGFLNENSSTPDDIYASYFTGLCNFAECKDSLDGISLYMGQNLLFREQEIIDWFDTYGGDTISASLLWEFPDMDSFLVYDDNSTIGANYSEIDPGFSTPVGNTDEIIANIEGTYYYPTDEWADWRITSPISWGDDGFPVLSWPPAFDLSYSNEGLQTAGTDGLPLGDLNWFPEKKAEYLENRDAIIESLRDSMANAQVFYDPLTMDETPLLTEIITSVEQINAISGDFELSNYPNPFNQATSIQLRLPQQSSVTLSVFNVLGVKVLEFTEKNLPTGTHRFNFDASTMSNGIYLYRVTAVGQDGQSYIGSKKMIKE